MKRRITIISGMVLVFCLIFTTAVMALQVTTQSDITYRSIKIVVNGTEIAPVDVNGDATEPFILNSDGSTYLPVRAVCDALGLNVDWDDATSTVILTSDGTEKFSSKVPAATSLTKKAELTYRDIQITLDGSKVALVNAKGETVEPFICNSSTYLPVRAVASALGCTIGWEDATSTVTITKKKPLALSIASQPKSTAIEIGSTDSVSIEVSGGTAPYTYEWQYDAGSYWGSTEQWYTQENPGKGVVISSSENKSTMTVTPGSAGYYLYAYPIRCIVTDAKGNSVTSSTITISNPTLSIIKQPPSSITIDYGQSGAVSIQVGGGTAPYTFEWQFDVGTYLGKAENWYIANNSNYGITTSASPKGKSIIEITPNSTDYFLYKYPLRCVVTDAKGNTVTSNQIKVCGSGHY